MESYINISHGKIQIDSTMLIISAWNSFIEGEEDRGSKISLNDEEFFKNSFETACDAAHAVSTGDYQWTDYFAFFDDEGRLISFSRLDDDTCPIDLDKIDISSLILELQELEAVHEATRML